MLQHWGKDCIKVLTAVPPKSKPSVNPNLSLCMLASGSRGNAIFVTDGATSILIDAGLSGKEIERRMGVAGLCPSTLSAIFVTHEHSDHIKGVGVLSRRYQLPVYITDPTLSAAPQLGKLHAIEPMQCGETFSLNGFQVHPFSISHDAADPVGFTIQCGDTKIGIATDLGIATGVVKEHLKGSDLLVLEANHDPDLLLNGPYPWPLKQRIKSRSGHLSNHDAKELLSEIQHETLQHVVLAHLSEENNTPEKAHRTLRSGLGRCRAKLTVARQDQCGEVIQLK